MKKAADTLPEVDYCTHPNFDDDGVQSTSGIRPDGKEEVDPVPMSPPLGYTQPPDLMTMIRTMIQSEALRAELAKQEIETFEEADDFEIEGDPIDALTEYEKVFMPPPNPAPIPGAASSAVPQPVSPSVKTSTEVLLDTSVLGDTTLAAKKEPQAPKKQD